jgi:hypothetical protein
MNKADQLIDRAADRLREVADRASAQGGITAKLGDELADDAAFLRRLKPSLILARAKGEAPTDLPTGTGGPSTPSRPQLGRRSKKAAGGLNPSVIIAAAFVAGIVVAKLIDWRGHAHPRD